MKQILQDMSSGETTLTESPSPVPSRGDLLINTTASLISAGTERMLVGFGKASYFEKARQQPEKVKMVLEKIQTDGLMSTVDAVRSKLAQPLPLGYCNVGVILETGMNCEGFSPGDRVVSNGPHAEIVRVAKNLCAKIPDEVDDESATFVVVASIGLQGIRLAQPTLGEAFVVTGAGLIGLLTIQLLIAHGCRVLAIDFDESKLEFAKQFGASVCNPAKGEDPVSAGIAFSRGCGVDAVIITASTKVSDPVIQAARMSRKRGRIVLVGVTGLELNRADFYEKELTFQVSCSYGPGRYDSNYEEKGIDYPIGFVRWTEQRNFDAVLDLMARGLINVKPLVTHRFDFENANDAYELLTQGASTLGIVLHYASSTESRRVPKVALNQALPIVGDIPVVGFIGAGNYASRMLIPAFKSAGAQLHTVVTSGGISGVIHGQKAGFNQASTDVDDMLNNTDINVVAIVTRHNSHSSFVVKALNAHKHVFVEKPLAINHEQLSDIENAYHKASAQGNQSLLMVGFNRRFSPHIQKMKALLAPIAEPKTFIMTINAGSIPSGHWTQDIEVGGGRLIGEACHFIDLMRFLVGSPICSLQVRGMGRNDRMQIIEDNATLLLGFEDGSFGTIHYLAHGGRAFPKERIEVFCAERVLQIDNFRKMRGYNWPGFSRMNLWRQDKGQNNCVKAFLETITFSKSPPIPFGELMEVARATIDAAAMIRQQQ